MLIIVDYGMGNLASVANAFAAIGAQPVVTNRPGDLAKASRVVLPGVGAFGEAMDRLREGGLIEPLREAVLTRRAPCLGICLGMQLLGESSSEHGTHVGLGWIEGAVTRLKPTDPSLHIPHVGWNTVACPRPSAIFDGVRPQSTFYFVHSYHLVTTDPAVTVGVCEYGGDVTAAVAKDHIFGTQFHPEKSQKHGLALLRNFLAVTTPC